VSTLQLLGDWKTLVGTTNPDALVFATRLGTSISPNNLLRRSVFPACDRLGLPRATLLTFRRTYSSWSHDKGVPGKVVAQLMGHANVDTTLNVYSQLPLMARFATPSTKIGGLAAPARARRGTRARDRSERGAAASERARRGVRRGEAPRLALPETGVIFGAPCTTRTCDLLVRRLAQGFGLAGSSCP
jgi:hypothetical protein